MKKNTIAVQNVHHVYIGSSKERNYFVDNLSMIISSGIPVLQAIDSIKTQIRSRRLRRIIDRLTDDINNGLPLWQAFQNSGMFNERTVSLVRIGEESGKLSDNLQLVAEQEQKDRELKSKLRSATLYPVFVLSLTIFVGSAVSWFILPRLATVFAQINVELPLVTRILINAGQFLGAYGVIVFPVVIALFALILYVLFYFSKTKFIGQWMLFHTPGFSRMLQEIELSRFGYLMGTLLGTGLTATQTLDSLLTTASLPFYKKLYTHIRASVEDGNSFQKTFSTFKHINRLIPPPIQGLIVAGEQSGRLPEMFLRVSKIYESKTENTTKNMSIILEPILLVVVWLGVVAVAVAIILPLYSLIGNFKAQ